METSYLYPLLQALLLYLSIYASSKGGMNELTKNLACEWAKDKIRVNSVAPWIIRTPLVDNLENDSTFLEIA
ncbi:hypothetical protein AB3S75_030893 [Citrus x aurantiifolia]